MSLCASLPGDRHASTSTALPSPPAALLKEFLPAKCGITTTFVPISDLGAVAAAITDRQAGRAGGAGHTHWSVLRMGAARALTRQPKFCCWRAQGLKSLDTTQPAGIRAQAGDAGGPPRRVAAALGLQPHPAPPPCRTRVIYTESLSNPTLVAADIPRLAELAQAKVGGGGWRRPRALGAEHAHSQRGRPPGNAWSSHASTPLVAPPACLMRAPFTSSPLLLGRA